MRMTMKDINDANEVIITLFNKKIYRIDKKSQKIYENDNDVTDLCLQLESKYTIGDMVIDSPYTFGMMMARVMKNQTDRKCLRFLKEFHDLRLM